MYKLEAIYFISLTVNFEVDHWYFTQIVQTQLAMIINRNETVLISLTEYSTIDNLEWASANALIPVDVATDVTVCIL